MTNIIIQDLEMNQDLDNVSLGDIIGGHGCHGRKKICKRRVTSYYVKIRRRVRQVKYVWKTYRVKRFKIQLVCYWR
jgi:hypothetical protein